MRMSQFELDTHLARKARKKCAFSGDLLGKNTFDGNAFAKEVKAAKCPHKAALDALAKKPDLLKGNQEHYEQVRIFYHYSVVDRVIYDLLVAIPNGGQRAKKTAADLKAEGVKAGYPDLLFDVAKGGYFGLKLELKQEEAKNARLNDNQRERLILLAGRGYYVAVAWGHKQAIAIIDRYMALPNTIFNPLVVNNDFNKAAS